MRIYTDNSIVLDGVRTGLKVTQTGKGTVVYRPEGISAKYAEHKMPHPRYSLSHDAPSSGSAGRAQFEADIRALIASF